MIQQTVRVSLGSGGFRSCEKELIGQLGATPADYRSPDLAAPKMEAAAAAGSGLISRPPEPPVSEFAKWIQAQVDLAQIYLARNAQISEQNPGFRLLKAVACRTATPNGMSKPDLKVVANAQLVLAEAYGRLERWAEACDSAESATRLYFRAEQMGANTLIAKLKALYWCNMQGVKLENIKEQNDLFVSLSRHRLTTDLKIEKNMLVGDLYLAAYRYLLDEIPYEGCVKFEHLKKIGDLEIQVESLRTSCGQTSLHSELVPNGGSLHLERYRQFKLRLLTEAQGFYAAAQELIVSDRGEFHPSILPVLQRTLALHKIARSESEIRNTKRCINRFHEKWAADSKR